MSLLRADLAAIDLTDPDLFAGRVPHGEFALLRAADPVHWHEATAAGAGFWALTKHADIAQVSRDTQTYSSAVGHIQLEDLEPDALEARRSMIETDPPDHTRLRRLVSPLFTPKAVEEYRQHAQATARRLLDEAYARGSFDWATDFCEPLPIRVFIEIMGIDESDADFLAQTANRLVTIDDPELAPTPEAYERVRARGLEPRLLPFRSPAALDLFDYGRKLGEERRVSPQQDLLTKLVQAEWEGDRLTDSEFVNFFQLLIFAGNETTRTSLQQGMLALIEHPEQLEPARGAARADSERGRRGPALGDADLLLPADRHGARRDPRAGDRGRRQGRHVLHLRQFRRRGVRGSVPLRRHAPLGVEAPHVRRRRAALLPRRVARAHAGRRRPRGVSRADRSASG